MRVELRENFVVDLVEIELLAVLAGDELRDLCGALEHDRALRHFEGTSHSVFVRLVRVFLKAEVRFRKLTLELLGR